MLDIELIIDEQTGEKQIATSISGRQLLTLHQLNKGTAFTERERHEFDLLGKLPPTIDNLEQQARRVYEQFLSYKEPLKRHTFLNNLHDGNQVLFYKLVGDHIEEMLPLIYTPHVGTVVKTFSHQFHQTRGLYITYPERDHIAKILDNRSNPEIDLIVVTDGECVLGIGDQGVGAINISIAKLMVYTLCAGVNPSRTLPIYLDVGTDNKTLLNDPFYLGWRYKRIRGEKYRDFIMQFIHAVQQKFPHVLLHWEDFSAINSRANLALCEDKVCAFNDDVQGTGAAALATLLAAIEANQSTLAEQRIIIFGAGSAGTGITDQIHDALILDGLSEAEACKRFWLIDRPGLLTTDTPNLAPSQKKYARNADECRSWNEKQIGLLESIRHVKPTVLIGCSTVGGAFTREIVDAMSEHCRHPIIFPLSNPTANSEADPKDIIQWTQNNVLIATGSPFPAVEFQGKTIPIAQCNNSFIFPGLGLAIVATKAKKVTKGMLSAAAKTLSQHAPIHKDPLGALLPDLHNTREIARDIAIAVARQAVKENIARIPKDTNIEKAIDLEIWEPKYLPLIKKKEKK